MQQKVIEKLKALTETGRTHGKPIYLCIRQAFEEMIVSGELPHNYRLPPDRELANQIGVTHITLGKSLNELRKQRLVERSRYHGTFVKSTVQDDKFVCTDRSNLVAIVFDDTNEKTFHSNIFVSLHMALQRNGYEIIFLSSSGNPDTQFHQVRSILQKPNCRGCILWSILHPNHVRELMTIKPVDFPLVFMDKYYDDVMHDYSVYDNYNTAVQLGDIYLRRGYERFIFMCREKSFKYSSIYDRYNGLRKSLIKRNLDPENVIPVTYSDSSPIHLDDILQKAENTMLFAATEVDALNIVEILRNSGHDISESYPIACWIISNQISPLLANVAKIVFDDKAMAEGAVSIFLERLHGDRSTWKKFLAKGRFCENKASAKLCNV